MDWASYGSVDVDSIKESYSQVAKSRAVDACHEVLQIIADTIECEAGEWTYNRVPRAAHPQNVEGYVEYKAFHCPPFKVP